MAAALQRLEHQDQQGQGRVLQPGDKHRGKARREGAVGQRGSGALLPKSGGVTHKVY